MFFVFLNSHVLCVMKLIFLHLIDPVVIKKVNMNSVYTGIAIQNKNKYKIMNKLTQNPTFFSKITKSLF
jgi:hypothetical protein